MERLLLFRLGDELYALEVAQVQEVVESPRYHYIPRAPALFAGAINFHGSVVPVLDLAPFLGCAGSGRDGRVIVLPAEVCALGLAVTAVQRIVPLDGETLLPLAKEGRAEGCCRAVFDSPWGEVNLLDVDRLLAGLEKSVKETGGDHGA